MEQRKRVRVNASLDKQVIQEAREVSARTHIPVSRMIEDGLILILKKINGK